MIKLDADFLRELGLETLSKDEQRDLLAQIYSTLESRVGHALVSGLTDEQLETFEAFINRDEAAVLRWFEENAPNIAQDEDFRRMAGNVPDGVSRFDALCEYGSLRWLKVNCPNYAQVVQSELDTLRAEIASSRDRILGIDS